LFLTFFLGRSTLYFGGGAAFFPVANSLSKITFYSSKVYHFLRGTLMVDGRVKALCSDFYENLK
jgi:hypothetical protein